MLVNTFQHIHGIGPKTETDLWSRGVHDWDAIENLDHNKILSGKYWFIKTRIPESREALKKMDFSWFAGKLPSREHWRIYWNAMQLCRYPAAFIDIETAFSGYGDQFISTIALYDGEGIHCFIRGKNLWDFPEFIKKYSLIITYSGRTFDIPFIERYFGIKLENTHIDLRYVLAGMGYKGGLKKCEKLLGFRRTESDGMEGAMAPYLWNEYERTGNHAYLHTLLAYNIEDVLGLYHLMHRAFEIGIEKTPFAGIYRPEYMNFPEMPYRADMELKDMLASYSSSWS